MEGRFEHDPSMTRDRPETVVPQSLTFQVRSHASYGKTHHFVHPLSLKNALCTRLPSNLPKCMLKTCKTKQFCETSSKNVPGRHEPTRHESANYIVGTILKLQNTMKFQRQLIHQQHLLHIFRVETIQELQNAMEFHQQNVHQVKTLVAMEGRFEQNPSMTRDRPETVVPQSLTFQFRSHALYGKTQHFVHPLSFKNALCTRLPSNLPKCMLKTCKTKQFCETSSKKVPGRHEPTRHESANYLVGTILKLQNTMKFQRQLIHQQHLLHIFRVETIQELQNAMEFHQQNVYQKQVQTLVTMRDDSSMIRA